MSEAMPDLIKQYIQTRADARLEKWDKEAEKTRAQADFSAEQASQLAEKRAAIVLEYQANAWLSDAAQRAKQLSFATHPIKFTHTDAKGASSVFAQGQASPGYLSTASLRSPLVDVAGNAAALDVAQLLQLEANGVSLANMLRQNDASALAGFAESAEQVEQWREDFCLAFSDKEIRSHSLAKQVYFPLGDGSYHLLSPLFSSSLVQALYERVNHSRFSDAAVEVRKLKRENKFSSEATVAYFNLAVQKFGGTKPQNVSQANSRRGGKTYLLSCRAPIWQSRTLPALNHKQAFWRAYEYCYDRLPQRVARQLREYLSSKLEHDSNKKIRDHRAHAVDELIDTLLQFAAQLQNQRQHAGWSAQSKLPRAEQLWLDPYRPDPDFRQERASKAWHAPIAEQFAAWLNGQLRSDKLDMAASEFQEWDRLLTRKLARLQEDLNYDDEEWQA